MTEIPNLGVLSVGVSLPPTVRTNDWWPEATVDAWRARARSNVLSGAPPEDPALLTPGVRQAMAAMAELKDDPFKGFVERRIMSEGTTTSDLQAEAVADALKRAGVDKREVGLLLVNSQLPEYLVLPAAPAVHRKTGLPATCIALDTEAAENSFLMQLALAEGMIRSGKVGVAVLVQASGFAHLTQPQDEHSAWFGDGATAVVVGPVPAGRGLLGMAHLTDGTMYETAVVGRPGGRWYGPGGDLMLYVENHTHTRNMLLTLAEMGGKVMNQALAQAGVRADDVRFYASHQATAWFRRVTQSVMGFDAARFSDTCKWTGSLGASNIPISLATGEREGLLQAGDLVALYTGGRGITWSAAVMRWGA